MWVGHESEWEKREYIFKIKIYNCCICFFIIFDIYIYIYNIYMYLMYPQNLYSVYNVHNPRMHSFF